MNRAGRSSNGRTAAFEAVNLGSIPSLPALPRNDRQVSFEAVNLGSSLVSQPGKLLYLTIMTKRILHGGFERRNNELNNSFYRELVRDLPIGATLLLVYFASENDEVREAFIEQTNRIHEITQKDLKFVLATEQDFMEQIKRADAIHFRGGHTPKLLSALKLYPNLESELEGKTLSGSSAGAYALGRYGVGHTGADIREGLGIVPVRIVCHYESKEMPPNSSSYAKILTLAPELELVQLRDCDWRVFD